VTPQFAAQAPSESVLGGRNMTLVDIILWIVLGGLAGWLATLVMGQDASVGLIGNIVLGIVGAFVGGLIFGLLPGVEDPEGVNIVQLIVAVIGAIVVLFIVRLVRRAT
jgi:uncharacterized membrane protein YeaQ/YmgE (transglycosylase-associated protein family)